MPSTKEIPMPRTLPEILADIYEADQLMNPHRDGKKVDYADEVAEILSNSREAMAGLAEPILTEHLAGDWDPAEAVTIGTEAGFWLEIGTEDGGSGNGCTYLSTTDGEPVYLTREQAITAAAALIAYAKR